MSEEKIVLITDPEAAQPHTMQGWKSRDGFFYQDERTARYAGCTHVPCGQCGKPTRKGYLKCDDCRDAEELAAFKAMPELAWDGSCMVYSHALDRYFSNPGEAEDELEEGQELSDLRLVLCTPNFARQLDVDYFADELPEDDDEVPPAVEEAIRAFNVAVAGVILSWSPAKVRLKLDHTA
jgi:hypothetical protein